MTAENCERLAEALISGDAGFSGNPEDAPTIASREFLKASLALSDGGPALSDGERKELTEKMKAAAEGAEAAGLRYLLSVLEGEEAGIFCEKALEELTTTQKRHPVNYMLDERMVETAVYEMVRQGNGGLYTGAPSPLTRRHAALIYHSSCHAGRGGDAEIHSLEVESERRALEEKMGLDDWLQVRGECRHAEGWVLYNRKIEKITGRKPVRGMR
ncbi:MAG: hypothetical protein LUD47_01145 [Clostridia bacterium]|nr:hypothetical protein [Clostridia bacterium]